MRVLHIGLSHFPGGVESFVKNYFDALKGEVTFDFIDIYGQGIAFSDEFRKAGGKIFTVPNYKKHPLSTKKKLCKIIKKYRCVHIHMLSAAGMIPLEAAASVGVEPIVHAHNSDTVGLVRRMMHSRNVNKLRSIPSFHAACGEEAGKWMWGDTGFTVIANAIDVEKFRFNERIRANIRDKFGCSEKTKVIGFVGRLATQKNPLYALRVFERFHHINDDSQLWIVGDGHMYDEVGSEIARLSLTQCVKMLGRRNDVNDLMQGMDVFLFPSVFEGLPITAIEAQASGLNVLASDVITKEAIILDSAMVLPLNENYSLWAERINTINMPENRAECADLISAAGYDISKAGEKLLKIYKSR